MASRTNFFRTALAGALLLAAGGGALTAADAAADPSATVTPQYLTFPREALDHGSAPKAVTITAPSDEGVFVTGWRIGGTGSGDFRTLPFGKGTTCNGGLAPGKSCQFEIVFKPLSLFRNPVAILTVETSPNSASVPEIGMTGAVPWALKFSSSPQNSTGSPVIVTATVNKRPGRQPGHRRSLDYLNMFVEGKFSTDCTGRTCQLSLSAKGVGKTTYEIAADVGPLRARPGSAATKVTKRESVTVTYTPPHCPGGSCS